MYFQQGDFWSFWENRPTADPEEGEDSLPIWSPWMDGWSGGQLGKNCGKKRFKLLSFPTSNLYLMSQCSGGDFIIVFKRFEIEL